MICSFLFAALLFCLQRFFFVCSVPFLFAAFLFCLQRFFFVCSVSFLFAAFLFCLQRSSFLFAAFLFLYLQRFPFLFAALLFCLQRFFFVCNVSLVGHRTNFIAKSQLLYMGCRLTIERKQKKNPISHFQKSAVRLRECVKTESDFEVKRGFEKASVSRDVRLRECPLETR